MTHGSLFSGIGGFDLAAQWAGWENIFHCEWNEFGQKVLHHYWPNSISYGDITKTDFTIHRGTIDVLSGGFPCQPYSAAGKRLGKEDERHLWPEMLRAIREIQPGWVVGENVLGLTNWSAGLVFEEVQTNLEAEGYEVLAYVLPACSVGAPHRRDRVWFIAYNTNTRLEDLQFRGENGIYEPGVAPNTASTGRKEWKQNNGREDSEENRSGMDNRLERSGNIGITPNANQFNGDISGFRAGEISQFETSGVLDNITANAFDTGLQRCELGRTPESNKGRQQTSGSATQFHKGNNWRNFPTQPPVRCRNDGFSPGLAGITISKHRNESIKAYGNAVVPQVVYQIFKAINEYELTNQ